jgi:DNA-directed RNA polymerase specialized sigma24 family protein
MPDLATREGQARVDKVIGDAKVVIVDNLSCLVRSARENEGDDWRPFADWALRQRAQGRSVLMLHHANKGGQQRGTSRREDLLDCVIALRRPTDYRPEQGARFVVEFEKYRSRPDEDIRSFEAALETDSLGRQVWTMQDSDDALDDQVIELAKLGLKQAEIARELGIHRSTVLRTLRRAEEQGRYQLKKGGRHG